MPGEVTLSVAAGGDEAAEQVARPAGLRQLLGVALHRDDPVVGALQAFDDPVGAPRRHPKAPTDLPGRLVMEAVDAEMLGSHCLRKPGVAIYVDVVSEKIATERPRLPVPQSSAFPASYLDKKTPTRIDCDDLVPPLDA